MAKIEHVAGFITRIRRKLNQHHLWNVLLWTALAAGLTMLLVALVYVVPGYTVPKIAFLVVAAVSALVAGAAWYIGKRSQDDAARYGDEFFGLKDSVASCSNFNEAGLEGGFYDLQARKTEQLVNETSVSKIQYAFPYRLAASAFLLVAIAVALGFKGPSDKVVQRLKSEKATLLQTQTANEELKELIEELETSIDDEEEKKLIDPAELRKWVDELEETKDRKEAMRQYARLEMKVNEAANALKQRKDEKLMDLAAEELKKAEDLKALAAMLEQKKYKKASDDLKDLKPSKLTKEDLKRLSEKRKDLAKLKAAAKRMAEAAKRANSRKTKNTKAQNQTNNGKRSAASKSSKNNAKAKGAGKEGDGQATEDSELAELLEDLDDAVDQLDEDLEEMEMADLDLDNMEEFDGDFDDLMENEDAVRGKLDRLGKKLMRMARKRSARSKLRALSAKCSECQANANAAQMAQSNQAGGREAGTGASNTSRSERDKLVDNGQTTGLKGLKGSGPSISKLESADDGTGVSGRRAAASKREFKRQFESFVEREDIPEDLKAGVKNYFTNIHEDDE